MSKGDQSFNEALGRLEEIVEEVKKDGISLDDSLVLLEEGVELANVCTEKTDHTYWKEETEEERSDGEPTR